MIPFSSQIRQTFIDFFKKKGHIYAPQSPITQPDDPTIMFTNAGMNQFKDIFLGNKQPKEKRLVNSQLCLRVSGKHNDLDEVGVDNYHHTLFEMLGNWSMGDYFKKEAIEWSYELLTEQFKINKDRIYVTVFQGDEEENLSFDQEAYDIWKTLVPEDHIVYGNKHDNFWEMGEVGPCGPCSEIHIDLRENVNDIPGYSLVNKNDPNVIEIWNLVFMQYERLKSGELKLLNNRYVDTGMGFERLVRILQGKTSNYDTDIFLPYIVNICNLTGKKYGIDEKVDVAMRVISDHIRAVTVAICDGVLPSNVKEGYVIRRILRRAIRYGFSFLDINKPTLHKLCAVVVAQLMYIKPEFEKKQLYIEEIIRKEEEDFLRTINRGIIKLNEVIENNKDKVIDGRLVFELYDTYGFPVDLTEIILREKDFTFDKESFDKALNEQKERSRIAANVEIDADWIMLKDENQTFIGYDTYEKETTILGYREYLDKDKILYNLILKDNPFYGESGGQIGDSGVIICEDKEIIVKDSRKSFGLTYIFVESLPSNINAPVLAKIDIKKRKNIAIHHTATHLLQATLRQILGNEVEQRGSYVCDKYLRFDFSYNNTLLNERNEEIEKVLTEKIGEEIELIEYLDVDFEEAKKLGAMCLFENKYGNKVRVIKYGNFSTELCGGTHVENTKELLCFKITNVSAIAKGIKRIEAVAGYAALELYKERVKNLDDIEVMICNKKDPVKGIKDLIDNKILNETLLGAYRQQIIKETAEKLAQNFENINGKNFIFTVLDLIEFDLAKIIVKQILKRFNGVVFLCTKDESNKMITINIGSNDDNNKADEIYKKLEENIMDAKGGGNNAFAIFKTKNTIVNIEKIVRANFK